MLSKSQLASVFRRNGSSGAQTIEFDELTDREKIEVSSLFEAIEGEEPIMVHRGKGWTIITNVRVIFNVDGVSDQFSNEDVKSATFDRRSAIKYGARNASDLEILVVTLRDGKRHQLKFESGQPFSGA